MKVNGIELEVGQVWTNLRGQKRKIIDIDESFSFPITTRTLSDGRVGTWLLSDMKDWKLEKPKREITLYRYIYELSDGEVIGSSWTSRENRSTCKILKTETKVIEVGE